MLVDGVEARGLHLVLYDERFAATCGCGGLGAVPRVTYQSTVFSGV